MGKMSKIAKVPSSKIYSCQATVATALTLALPNGPLFAGVGSFLVNFNIIQNAILIKGTFLF